MKQYIKKIYSIILLAFLAFPTWVLAVDTDPRTNLGQATPDLIKKGDINVLIGQIIQGVLSFLGVIFVVLIIYAGFMWMTAGGDSSKVQKAKDIIVRAIVGLIIVMSSYAITFTIISELTQVQ